MQYYRIIHFIPGRTSLKYKRNYPTKWFVQKSWAAIRVIFHLALFLLGATSTAGIERDSNQFNLSGIPRRRPFTSFNARILRQSWLFWTIQLYGPFRLIIGLLNFARDYSHPYLLIHRKQIRYFSHNCLIVFKLVSNWSVPLNHVLSHFWTI